VDSVPSGDYGHRKNEDGTFDSICLYCFQTIASAADELKLTESEKGHLCEPKAACRKIAKANHKKS